MIRVIVAELTLLLETLDETPELRFVPEETLLETSELAVELELAEISELLVELRFVLEIPLERFDETTEELLELWFVLEIPLETFDETPDETFELTFELNVELLVELELATTGVVSGELLLPWLVSAP